MPEDIIIITPNYEPLSSRIKTGVIKLVSDGYPAKFRNIAPGTDGSDAWVVSQQIVYANQIAKQIASINGQIKIIIETEPKYPVKIPFTGLINGVNRQYTLSQEFYANSLWVFYNGVKQDASRYTVDGELVTLNFAPKSEQTLEFYAVIK
jgi:hypothetical protein